MRPLLLYLAILPAFFAPTPTLAAVGYQADTVRAVTVEQLLKRENIGHVVIDEDRGYAYFEYMTAAADASGPLPYASVPEMMSALKRIHVVPLDGRTPVKPLFEQDNEAGYFFASDAPWSPDGRYLAVYKMKDRYVQPAIFDARRSRLQVFDLGVIYDPHNSRFSWISDTEFSVSTDTDGGDSLRRALIDGVRTVSSMRERGWRGRQVTAKAVGVGRFAHPSIRIGPGLASVNVETGEIRRLGRAGSDVKSASSAASNKVVGRLVQKPDLQAEYSDPIRARKVEVSLIDLSDGDKQVIEPAATEANYYPIAWSGSGKYFVYRGATSDRPQGAFSIIDSETAATVMQLPEGASDPAWVGDRLVYSLTDEAGITGNDPTLNDNRIAVRINTPRPVATTADGTYFYIEDGDLWRADLRGARRNLTGDYPHPISVYRSPQRYGLSPPPPASRDGNTPLLEDVVFVADIEGRRHVVIFGADGGSFDAIAYPAESSELLAISGRGAVFLTHSYEVGSRLHYAAAGENIEPRVLHQFNEHLAGVSPAVGPVRISHKGYDGRDVSGWLYLPPGASLERPQPYPLVVVGYAGDVYAEQPSIGPAASIWGLWLNWIIVMEVFAAQGYAVLLPSIPLQEPPGEPMMQIMPAILSSLDAAIETGHVDPDRLAFSGQSYGGYTALAIAAQTDRFQAIVGMAVGSNLTSKYGQFAPSTKAGIGNSNLPGSVSPTWSESGQGRMGATPWEDPDRYVRNSPLFHADRVTTPVMLISGDLDVATPTAQAEEMFTALLRESKDALFVTYFGEEHLIHQPQNQRDMWARVFAFLNDTGVTAGPKTVH